MATVVVVLSGTWERSSTWSLAEVITASVVSGVISETDPTKVVLPTPKPPATTILTEAIADSGPSFRPALELAKSTKHPFEQVEIRPSLGVVDLMDPDQAVHRHIGDENPGHTQGHSEYRRDLRHRPPVPAEPQDRLALGAEDRQVARLVVRSGNHRLKLELVTRLRSAACHRVGPDERTLQPIVGHSHRTDRLAAGQLPHTVRKLLVSPVSYPAATRR